MATRAPVGAKKKEERYEKIFKGFFRKEVLCGEFKYVLVSFLQPRNSGGPSGPVF